MREWMVVALLVGVAVADVYLHNPRGSNNRNRGNGVNVENPNRLFDSQNNNKGGYCWGPAMTYYEASMLQIEWTSQHGCGAGHPNVDCDVILQYMCAPTVRDGVLTQTITEATKDLQILDPKTGEQAFAFGMHEPFDFYKKCSERTRNRGLFTADQNLPQEATAMRTRQENNQNNPHGFECEEERDYYPYWHPAPWRDIAVLTSNTDRCAYFKQHSQNVEAKYECSVNQFNNEAECTANGGSWKAVDAWNMDAPECIENGFSRDNHLGNTKTGFTNVFNWVIPRLDVLDKSYWNVDGSSANCVFRIRYNISSGDTRSFREVDSNGKEEMLDSSFNNENSPVKQDPYVGFGKDGNGAEWKLRLALNTDQYGRTFEARVSFDRSHMFRIARRPPSVSAVHRIINLNVRGKRGNIVQAYPAVEYDFVPNQLQVNVGDFVHFQWTGCDTNPNYAGEGRQGTDRSNVVPITDSRDNIPTKYDDQSMFTPEKAFHLAHLNQYDGRVCKTVSEQACCMPTELAPNLSDQDARNCMKLNDPDRAYFDGGLVQMNTAGTYHYMSTRNNNFTNRSQKGSITAGSILPIWGIVVAVAAAVVFVVGAIIAGGVYFAQTHPGSPLANVFSNVRI